MVLLKSLPLLLFAGACYSPDIRDCIVTCSQPDDCAPSQVCGNDGFCAAPSTSGTCAKLASVDAPIAASDASIGDAPIAPPADAWPMVVLTIKIDGRGTVDVPSVGGCDGSSGSTECQLTVKQGLAITLDATPKHNWRFDKWDDACKDQPATSCVLAPSTNVKARARFVVD